jgi:hypothetical protein
VADPGKQLERAFEGRHLAEARAAEYEAQGWAYAAKIARRQAAGHKATITRITRQLTQGD